MLPRSGEGREARGCPRWGYSLQASPLQWFRFRCTGWGRNFGVRLILTILSLPYIEVSINIQSVRYHLVNHPFSLFRGPVARPAPGPTHPHRSPLKPSVYCSFSSPRCPTLPLVSPVAKAGVGAAEMVLSQAPLLGVGPDGGRGGRGCVCQGLPILGV